MSPKRNRYTPKTRELNKQKKLEKMKAKAKSKETRAREMYVDLFISEVRKKKLFDEKHPGRTISLDELANMLLRFVRSSMSWPEAERSIFKTTRQNIYKHHKKLTYEARCLYVNL